VENIAVALMTGVAPSRVARHFAEKWGLSPAHVKKRYVPVAFRLLAQRMPAEREGMRAWYEARLERIAGQKSTPPMVRIRAIMACARLYGLLDHHRPPVQVNNTGLDLAAWREAQRQVREEGAAPLALPPGTTQVAPAAP
jgi:hypothetical protein